MFETESEYIAKTEARAEKAEARVAELERIIQDALECCDNYVENHAISVVLSAANVGPPTGEPK